MKCSRVEIKYYKMEIQLYLSNVAEYSRSNQREGFYDFLCDFVLLYHFLSVLLKRYSVKKEIICCILSSDGACFSSHRPRLHLNSASTSVGL